MLQRPTIETMQLIWIIIYTVVAFGCFFAIALTERKRYIQPYFVFLWLTFICAFSGIAVSANHPTVADLMAVPMSFCYGISVTLAAYMYYRNGRLSTSENKMKFAYDFIKFLVVMGVLLSVLYLEKTLISNHESDKATIKSNRSYEQQLFDLYRLMDYREAKANDRFDALNSKIDTVLREGKRVKKEKEGDDRRRK